MVASKVRRWTLNWVCALLAMPKSRTCSLQDLAPCKKHLTVTPLTSGARLQHGGYDDTSWVVDNATGVVRPTISQAAACGKRHGGTWSLIARTFV